MNGFERHGIKHTSASSINMWAESQAAWVAKYLYKKKFPFSAAARAGVLAEDAVVSVLRDGLDEGQAIDEALKKFNQANMFNLSKDIVKRRDAIPDMVSGLLNELRQYGKPTFNDDGSQIKLSINCKGDGWELPVIGFIDLYYPDHNLIVDIKTTFRAPSAFSAEHGRQQAIYKTAFNMQTRFLYATPKKTVWLDSDDSSEALADIKNILNRKEFLLRSSDKEFLRKTVAVNDSSYYWSGAEDIKKELFC